MIRNKNGKFSQIREIWTPEKWDEGYIDNNNRFRVYRPDYPRAYAEGYALRYHVVWWLKTGEVHPKGTNLHHKNEIKIDDQFENLELMGHGAHSSHHNRKPVFKNCLVCEAPFEVQKREKERRKTMKYCSTSCAISVLHTEEHKRRISEGLKLAYEEGRR